MQKATALAVLAVSALFVVVGATDIRADEPDTHPVRPRLAVLEFHDYSHYRGHLLGRRAAETLGLALEDTGRWQLINSAVVRRACRDLDLAPPFAAGYQQAVAHRIGAEVVVTGRIEGLQISPAAGKVTVKVVLEFVERIGGQSLLSMEVSGSAQRDHPAPRPTDIIVEEALAAACADVATIAATVPAAPAEVIAVDEKHVTLRSGAETALHTGDIMLLYRIKSSPEPVAELLAVLMVKNTAAPTARAAVVETLGTIYTGDLAVCVGPARQREPTTR